MCPHMFCKEDQTFNNNDLIIFLNLSNDYTIPRQFIHSFKGLKYYTFLSCYERNHKFYKTVQRQFSFSLLIHNLRTTDYSQQT